MARHKNAQYRPFRRKRTSDSGVQEDYGNFHWYNPHTKKVEVFDTDDEQTAWKLSREKLGETVGIQEPAKSTATPATEAQSGNIASSSSPLIETTTVRAAEPNTNVIDMWVRAGNSERSPGVEPEGAGIRPVATKPAAKKPGQLTPEQSARIAGALKNLTAKLNVVALEASVRWLGRDPFPVEDDDLEILALGWELQLEEWMVKQTPRPWMLIVGGNLMLVATMYLRGRELPEKKDDGSTH